MKGHFYLHIYLFIFLIFLVILPIIVGVGIRLGNHDSVKTAKSLPPPEACHQLATGETLIEYDGTCINPYTGLDLYCAGLNEGPGGGGETSAKL